MSKRASSKYKIDRRMGENIWGRPKSPVNRREYGPGQHGQKFSLRNAGSLLKLAMPAPEIPLPVASISLIVSNPSVNVPSSASAASEIS